MKTGIQNALPPPTPPSLDLRPVGLPASEFDAARFTIITLWSGNLDSELRTMQWLRETDVPKHTRLVWIDNSRGVLSPMLHGYRLDMRPRFASIEILRDDVASKGTSISRHLTVAYLYTIAITLATEHRKCDYIVLLEDDTVPLVRGIRRLLAVLMGNPDAGFVAATYRTRCAPDRICAKVLNGGSMKIVNLPTHPFLVEYSGGGFAIAKASDLRDSLPFRATHFGTGTGVRGWDINLCEDLRERGKVIISDPGVFCDHNCKSVRDYLAIKEHKERNLPKPAPTPERLAALGNGRTVCIVTAHNYGHFLSQCLESLVRQTRPFDLILVMDDASTDDTPQVIRKWQKSFGWIEWSRGQWGDPSLARQAGAAMTGDSEFVLFVDADNHLDLQFHEMLWKELTTSPQHAVAYPAIMYFGCKGGRLAKPFDRLALQNKNYIDTCSLMRRKVLDEVGGWQQHNGQEDWLLWLKVVACGWSMVLVPSAILNYRRHAASRTGQRSLAKTTEIMGSVRRLFAQWLARRCTAGAYDY